MKNNDSNQREGGQGELGGIRDDPLRNMYKGHVDKDKGGRFEGGKWGWVGERVMVG